MVAIVLAIAIQLLVPGLHLLASHGCNAGPAPGHGGASGATLSAAAPVVPVPATHDEASCQVCQLLQQTRHGVATCAALLPNDPSPAGHLVAQLESSPARPDRVHGAARAPPLA
jgi:hypothetical protein